MRLEGKIALITGGARGMGAAEAFLFAREAAEVIIADILEVEGKQVEDKMLSELAGLKKLEILELRSTSVTKGGIAKLKKALPKLRVLNSKTGSRFLVNGKKQAGTTVKQKPRQ